MSGTTFDQAPPLDVPAATPSGARRYWLAFGLIWAPLLVWWLAFYPGLTIADSLNSWNQVRTGVWESPHPPPFTALVWLFTRLTYSPAPMSFAQTAAMAAALAYLVVVLRRRFDAGRWPLAAAVLMAALPWLGPFSVTVWKDTPTLAALFVLAALLIRATERGEDGLTPPSWGWVAAVFVTCLAIALLRWNGVATVGVALVLGALPLVRGLRWRSLVAGLLAGGIGFATLTLLPTFTPVEPLPVVFTNYSQLADLSQMSRRWPSTFTPEDRAVMEQVAPFAAWQYFGGRCYWMNDVAFKFIGRQGLEDKVAASASELNAVWRRVSLAHPAHVIQVRACRASLVWRIRQPQGSGYGTFTVPNQQLVTPHAKPPLPWLHSAASSALKRFTSSPVVWMFWVPVPWFLLFGLVAAFLWRGYGRRLLVVSLSVPVAVMVSYAVSAASNDARYTLPAIFILAMLIASLVGGWLGRRRRPTGA